MSGSCLSGGAIVALYQRPRTSYGHQRSPSRHRPASAGHRHAPHNLSYARHHNAAYNFSHQPFRGGATKRPITIDSESSTEVDVTGDDEEDEDSSSSSVAIVQPKRSRTIDVEEIDVSPRKAVVDIEEIDLDGSDVEEVGGARAAPPSPKAKRSRKEEEEDIDIPEARWQKRADALRQQNPGMSARLANMLAVSSMLSSELPAFEMPTDEELAQTRAQILKREAEAKARPRPAQKEESEEEEEEEEEDDE